MVFEPIFTTRAPTFYVGTLYSSDILPAIIHFALSVYFNDVFQCGNGSNRWQIRIYDAGLHCA